MFANKHNYAKICALTVAFIVIITSVSVMIGWFLQIESVTQINKEFAPMQFNTALLFLISSIAIIYLVLKRNKLALIFAGILFLYTSLQFSQYLLNIDLGIDTLFVTPFTSVKTAYIGRPSQATLTCFLLLSLAVITYISVPRRKAVIPSLILNSIVIAIAAMSIFSYIDPRFTLKWYDLSGMALHTSLLMLSLAFISVYGILEHPSLLKYRKFILSLPLFCLFGTLAVMMWVSFSAQEKKRLFENQQISNMRLVDSVEHAIFTNYYDVLRLGTKAEKLDELGNLELTQELESYLNSEPSLKFVGIADPKGNWVFSKGLKGVSDELSYRLLFPNSINDEVDIQVSKIENAFHLVLIFKLNKEGNHHGYIAVAYNLKDLIKDAVTEEDALSQTSLLFNGIRIYGEDFTSNPIVNKTNNFFGNEITAFSSEVLLEKSSEGILPELAGIGGLLLAFASAGALYQYYQAKDRAETTNRNFILTQAILDSMDNGVITLSSSGSVKLVNPKAIALLKTTEAEFYRWFSVQNLVNRSSNLSKHPIELSLQNDLKITNAVDRFFRPDKTTFTAEYTTRNVSFGEDHITVIVFKDITKRLETDAKLTSTLIDLKTQNLQLEIERERAEEANKAKSQFLVNMSHELRTPLNGIIGIGELLKNTPLDEKQANYVNLLSQSSETLYSLIKETLDINKIEAGEVDVELTPFSLHEFIQDISKVYSIQSERKHLTYSHKIDKSLPKILYGDPNRIRQVLNNLLTNALKFTAAGTIKLTVTLIDETVSNFQIKFEVEDSGIGIPEKALPKLFQSFAQADHSHSRKYGGTGLGLAIVKKLVKLMKGKIGVSSVVGKGTCFWFILPLSKTGKEQEK